MGLNNCIFCSISQFQEFSGLCLSMRFQVPISHATKPEQKISTFTNVCKNQQPFTIGDSQDPLVANCKPQLKTGSWHVEEAVAKTESDVKNKLISGHHQFECKGLGYSPGPKIPSNKSTKL